MAKCEKCDLYKTSCAGKFTRVMINDYGNFESDILIVGGAPGYQEVVDNEPFVGEAGRLVRKNLQSLGLGENDYYMTSICLCRPPEGREPSKNEVATCFKYLEDKILNMKPRVIGLLGKTACTAFGITDKITAIHGNQVWSKKYNCWLLPLYKAGYVLKFINMAKQRREFLADLGKLKTLNIEDKDKEDVKYAVADTMEKVKKALIYLLKQKYVVFDIETNTLDFQQSKIACISFSAKVGTAIVIPYQYDTIFTKKEQKLIKRGLQKFFSSSVKKVAQYGKFDIKHLMKQNIIVNNYVFDTGLAHYLLDEKGLHNLDILIQSYTDMRSHKKDISEYLKSLKGEIFNKIFELEPSKLFSYAAKDADAEFRLFLKLLKLLKNNNLLTLFTNIMMPLTMILAQMELKGILVDKDYVDKMNVHFKYKLKTLTIDLYKDNFVNEYEENKFKLLKLEEKKKKRPPKNPLTREDAKVKFNFNSPVQLRELLYQVMEITPIKYTKKSKKYPDGNPSTDKDTLETLAQTTKYKLLADLLAYRKAKKLADYVQSYKELAEDSLDGRIHTNFNQAVTATGRLSSSAPNLQTIPSKERDPEGAILVRNCLIAKPGYSLIESDYSQMEFKLWGAYSQDKRMIDYILSANPNDENTDIHRRVAAMIFNIPVEKVTKHQRALSKAAVYGVIYGMTEYALAAKFDISEAEALRVINGLFNTFPQGEKWIQEQIAIAHDTGQVRNMFGRIRRLDDIYNRDRGKVSHAERQAQNFPIQSASADIAFMAMIKLNKEVCDNTAYMVLMVHDSIIVECEESRVIEVATKMKYAMENAVKLSVPLPVDVKVGKKLGEMSEIEF